MAKFKGTTYGSGSTESLNYNNLNLYNAFSSAETASFKKYGYTLNGIRYPEALHAYSYEGSLYFAGDVNHYEDYRYPPLYHIITGGVVNHIHVDARDSGNWHLYDFNYDYNAFESAANSKSNADDLKIIKNILSGNDDF